MNPESQEEQIRAAIKVPGFRWNDLPLAVEGVKSQQFYQREAEADLDRVIPAWEPELKMPELSHRAGMTILTRVKMGGAKIRGGLASIPRPSFENPIYGFFIVGVFGCLIGVMWVTEQKKDLFEATDRQAGVGISCTPNRGVIGATFTCITTTYNGTSIDKPGRAKSRQD